MDAGRLRRETGRFCLSFHGLMRVMTVAVQGFQAYFDVLIFGAQYNWLWRRSVQSVFRARRGGVWYTEKKKPGDAGLLSMEGIAMLIPLAAN